MPIPRAIAKANRNGLNHLTRRFAGRIPPFVLLAHTGRRSGNAHTVPLMAFRGEHPGEFIIALTYGETTDWQRNIEAGGPASLVTRGVERPIAGFRTADRRDVAKAIPWPIHRVLDLLGADRVAIVDTAEQAD